MNYHIVRMNETIDKIALIYNLSVEEIKEINKHIRNWDNITPGIKLNLPQIPEALKDDLNDVEPFIEDYYPRYDEVIDNSFDELVENNNLSEVPNELNNDLNVESKTNSKETKNTKPKYNYPFSYYNGYYPPYPYYYPYYPYYNKIRIRKK